MGGGEWCQGKVGRTLKSGAFPESVARPEKWARPNCLIDCLGRAPTSGGAPNSAERPK